MMHRAGVVGTLMLLLGVWPRTGDAQEQSYGPVSLSLPWSTGAAALGNAFVLVSRDSDGVFYNPALLAEAQGVNLGVQRWSRAGTLASASGARGWAGGGVGVGLLALHYGAPTTDPIALPRDPAFLFEDGGEGGSELVASAGYAREVRGVRIGVAAKLIQQRLGEERDATAAGDVGAAMELGPLNIGLALQNLGPALKLGRSEVPLMHRLTLAASTRRRPLGPLDIGATGAASRDAKGDITAGLGVEVAWWPIVGRTFIARVGIQRVEESSADPFTFGAAFFGDEFFLEYAYQGFDEARKSHRMGIGWR
jgi:hypothetical protein